MESLPERFGGYGRLEIGEDLDVTAHKKTGVNQRFENHQALIFQPSRRRGSEGGVSDVGKGRTPPKRQRRRKQVLGARGVAFCERGAAFGC